MIHLRHYAFIAMLFLGAACSTVSSRINERPQAFQKLPPAEQALVESGKIQNGSGRDAVYLAWGKADKITQDQTAGKPAETWTYFGFRQETIPYYEVIPRAVGRRGFVPDTVYSPVYVSHRYVRRQVTFQNEKVVAWTEGQFR